MLLLVGCVERKKDHFFQFLDDLFDAASFYGSSIAGFA
jgi:hypothetical protein